MKIKAMFTNKWFKLLLLLLAAGVIFFFSSQPADDSQKVSGFFSKKVLYVVEKIMNVTASDGLKNTFAGLDHYVRKFGHFFEYFILGLLAANFFLKKDKRGAFIISVAFCIVYAASDEFHQMFVPGRGPAVADVVLDSVAALIAVSAFLYLKHKNSPRLL